MNLVDFILDNIYFVIIVLFAIVSMLSKGRGSSQQGRQSPPGMPPYGGESTHPGQQHPERPLPERMEHHRVETMEMKRKPVKVQPSLKEIEARIEKLRTESDELEAVTTETLEMNSKDSNPYERPNKTPYSRRSDDPYVKQTQTFTRTDLRREVIRGKMWSEVFGPPRAKNPYRGNIRK